jgi:type II secretory pathway predicted ATPase ExeA
MYRQRFGLTGHPLPKDAQGKTFFDKSPGFKKLERAFRQLVADPGLGVLTADAGIGKTAALRHLCAQLPKPDHLVLYLCAAVGSFDFYRALALELGLRPPIAAPNCGPASRKACCTWSLNGASHPS